MTTVPVIKLCHYLQECYIGFTGSTGDVSFILLQLIQLQHLKILHFSIHRPSKSTDEMSVFKLEEQIGINTTLHELVVTLRFGFNNAIGVIKGVTRNKSIKTFSLTHDLHMLDHDEINSPVYVKTIEHLLKANNTLQALKLDIPDTYIPSLNIVEVNTPLTALKIEGSHQLISILPQHIKGLHCLILNPDHYIDDKIVNICQLYPLPLLFQCNPYLQQLELTLDTTESVIELFTILQSNATLKALRVKMEKANIFERMGPSLQKMVTLNKTIEYLEIDFYDCLSTFPIIPSTYLSFLTTGLSYNTNLQELSVPIPLSDTNFEQITTLFNVISCKNKLTQLKVNFTLDQLCVSSDCSYEEIEQTPLFYEQGLPLITNMLQSHITMRFLSIKCSYNLLSQSSQIEITQHFWQTVFFHPTLQYIKIRRLSILMDTLKSQQKTLIDIHKQKPPKPLPIIEF